MSGTAIVESVTLTPEKALILEEVELRELCKAVALFVENYQRMHDGTAYAVRVDYAALQVKEKLRELL